MKQQAAIIAVFGTRPEIIKLSPVLTALAAADVRCIKVDTGQQADLSPVFLRQFVLDVDYRLDLMQAEQPLNQLLGRILAALDPVLVEAQAAATVVQGDTLSALGGALASRLRDVPVVHVEAGLRSGDANSPFPEEINRRLISQVAALHCAPTAGNVENLLAQGISADAIMQTGNPVVDALQGLEHRVRPSALVARVLEQTRTHKRLLLTAHRRESFGARLEGYFTVIRRFVARNADTALIFPVHPNPAVGAAARQVFASSERVYLIDPVDYADFLALLEQAWLVLSDSGGVQEEVASLGKPLLVLRNVTERPEVLESELARLMRTERELDHELADRTRLDRWCERAQRIDNPFGDGRSGPRIAEFMMRRLLARRS